MALEREIEKEELHPSVDELKLHELKRRKLVLKDEIAKLRQTADKEMVH
ncbi:MAG: YdcH family protein [Rhodoblastus sp.]